MKSAIIQSPIVKAISQQINAGTLLLGSTAIALIVANSPLKDLYFSFFNQTYLNVDFLFWKIDKPVYYWINDGLMALFFLLIGLEIKRELLIGELSSVKKAMVPMVAAIGGIIVPAGLFLALNFGNPDTINGWAIPMATDIAFALGLMSMLGKRVPIELKVFLTSLAIVDDLAAVLAIAVYYTDTISVSYLGLSIAAWIAMLFFGKIGIRSLWVYGLVGLLLVWYPMLKSGVHATIAGVMIAFTIPMQRKLAADSFLQKVSQSLELFRSNSAKETLSTLNKEQYSAVETFEKQTRLVASPLQQLEHKLHTIVLYVIMPLFAFANTGIAFQGISFKEVFTGQLTLGIMLGLAVGKVLGIIGFVYLFRWLKIISIPEILTFRHLLGAGFLAGIGFTMSIFITDLAFHGAAITADAKLAILIASLISGSLGFFILSKSPKKI